MAFDIEFASNLSLPNFIGVGKNASIGYGIITKKQSEN
jgi:CRISPR/Cas system endoribonuclease Cas6 (RAMP superfamily)